MRVFLSMKYISSIEPSNGASFVLFSFPYFFIRDSEINIEYFYVSSFLPVSCTRKCTLYNVQYALLYIYRAAICMHGGDAGTV